MGEPALPGLAENAGPYLAFLERWLGGLEDRRCHPARGAVLVVDVVEGFCEHGALASPRVASMVPAVVALLAAYQQAGGTHVLLTEDAHPPDAREFASFPPHCLAGTSEASTVQAVAALEQPAWRRFPKQTINGLAEPALSATIASLLQVGVRDFVIVGDCTDLCIYQAAMALQLLLNRQELARYREARVIVPATAVQTYDLPVETAAELGAQPHPGDLLHAVFLHHLALNGVTVARNVVWSGSLRPLTTSDHAEVGGYGKGEDASTALESAEELKSPVVRQSAG